MEDDIKAVIRKAIKEDWYNEMTTSDLQGVCDAQAFQILERFKRETDLVSVMSLSEKILKGIYQQIN